MKRNLLLSTVAGLALTAASLAQAADLGRRPVYEAPRPQPPVPMFSWTGCFIGAHVGGGASTIASGHAPSSGSGLLGEDRSVWDLPVLATGSGTIRTEPNARNTIHSSGVVYGGQIGCDYQFAGPLVIGIQGSFSGTSIDGGAADNTGTLGITNRWIGDVTGRLGYSIWPQTLLYAKGGSAWTRTKVSLFPDSGDFRNTTLSGWIAGGGFEWAFAPNWSVFAEYDHYDFGNKTARVNTGEPDIIAVSIKPRIDVVKVGVNYRFGWQ